MKKNLRSMDLNLLTVFDAIMREGQLSAAGERLGMTQPAVSNALARLRLSFSDELFIRTRQGMKPTPRAQELIKPIRDALNIIQQAVEPGESFDPEHSQRRFRLAMSDFGELNLMPYLLQQVAQQSHSIVIECVEDLHPQNLDSLKQGQLDLAFDYRVPEDKQLQYTRLVQDQAVVVLHREHPRIAKDLTLQQYLAERHILLNHRYKQQTVVEQLLDGVALPRKVLAEVRQYTAVAEMISRTEALAVLPQRMAAYYAALLPIKYLPFPLELNPLSICMVWNRALEEDKGHRWLRELIINLAVQSGF